MRILLFLLLLSPIFASAQILRAYGVIEVGSLPTSSSTGPKFAYRPADSSFYRWVSGSTWVKIIPDEPDTLYLKQLSGTTALVDGDTIDISTYFLKSDTTSAFASYLKRPVGWGLSLLTGKYPLVDSLKVASRYYVDANFFPLEGGTLTGTGGAGFIGFPSQVSAPGTPSSGLNVYAQGSSFNWKGTDGFERQITSSPTGGRNYALPDISGTFALGTGTTDRSARWSGTNTLAAGNITDNGTKLEALKPWQFQSWTTAGRPTGVTGYNGYNTTLGGNEWYDGTRWNSVPKADRSAFTSTYVPFVNASGQFTESANLTFASSQFKIIGANSSVGTYGFTLQNSAGQAVFRVDNAGAIQQFGPQLSFSAYSDNATVYRLYSQGNGDNPFLFDSRGGARGSGYATLTLNADFNSNAYIGGGIFFDTRDGVAPLRFFTKDNSANPVDAMDIFDISTVGIGTNNTPINSAQLAVNSTTRGFLPPRWTAAQRAAISSPATGLIGYQTDGTEGVYVRQASAFKRLLWEGDAATTWLKTELEAGRDVNIAGTSSSDFRIQNTRIQFDNKLKVGSDSSFVYDPVQDSLYIIGDGTIKGKTVTPFRFIGPNNTSSNFKSQISLGDWKSSRGWNIGVDALETGANNMYFFNNSTGALPFALFGQSVLVGNFDLSPPSGITPNFHVRATLADGATVSNGALTRRWTNTGSILKGFKVGGITSFTKDVNADTLYNYGAVQLDALGTGTATTILGKTSANEIVPVSLSSLNGIYGGSGTLSQHTTRARIPDDGNFLISQLFNSDADSAYIQVINGLDGNREVRGGLTDTASVGYSTFRFYQDEADEEMGFDLRSLDNTGNTRVLAQGGNIRVIGSDIATVESSGEVRLLGLVQAKQEAYNEITSTSSPQTLSSTYSDNLINQGGTQATFTLEMPASPEDGQICTITFNNAISTLTIDGNGETIVGSAVVTGVPGSQRKFKFYSGIGWIKLY